MIRAVLYKLRLLSPNWSVHVHYHNRNRNLQRICRYLPQPFFWYRLCMCMCMANRRRNYEPTVPLICDCHAQVGALWHSVPKMTVFNKWNANFSLKYVLCFCSSGSTAVYDVI